MVTIFKEIPCVIKFNNEYFKVERPKKFFNRHREMNDENVEFYYIDETITGMQEIALALRDLEDSLKGVIREKKAIDSFREYTFKYRVNANTVLEAYTQEDLDKLKSWWNIEN